MSNQIVLTGNLGGPIELRYTPNGRAVANFSVADTPRRFNKQTNEWEDAGETLWARCSIWAEDAEALAEYAGDRKGRVTVVGRAGWQKFTRNDGTEGQAFTITATSVMLHAPRSQQGQQSQGGGFGQTQGFDQMQQAPAPQQQQDPWGGQTVDQSRPPF